MAVPGDLLRLRLTLSRPDRSIQSLNPAIRLA